MLWEPVQIQTQLRPLLPAVQYLRSADGDGLSHRLELIFRQKPLTELKPSVLLSTA